MPNYYVTVIIHGDQTEHDYYGTGPLLSDAVEHFQVERNAAMYPDGEVWWSTVVVQLVRVDGADVVDADGHFDIWSAIADGSAVVVDEAIVSGVAARNWQDSVTQ